MLRHEALAEVETTADAYTEAKAAYEAARHALDISLLQAKELKATFRELSHFSGRSVGFVQKALVRQGYVPEQPESRAE